MDRILKKSKEKTEANKNGGFTLNLTVCGSPAPIYSQQSKSLKEERPCVFSSNLKKKVKALDVSLAVDKIILLAEKLELTDGRKEKIESIDLLPQTFEIANIEGRVVKNDSNQLVTFRDNIMSEEVSFFPAKSLKDSGTHSGLLSPNFSIDLSSLTNNSDESDGSGNECEISSCQEESCATIKDEGKYESAVHFNSRPASLVHNLSRDYQASPRFSNSFTRERDFFERPCLRSPSPERIPCSDVSNDRFDLCANRMNSSGKNEVMDNHRMNQNGDLVCLYVNAVNDQNNLAKYFRPCRICNKTYCVCGDRHSVSQTSLAKSFDALQQREDKSLLNSSTGLNTCRQKFNRVESLKKINKRVGTDVNVTQFPCYGSECLSFRPYVQCVRKRGTIDQDDCVWRCPSHRSCPESSNIIYETHCCTSETERKSACARYIADEFRGSGTLKPDYSNDYVGPNREICSCVESDRLLTYTSSLASAARSARNLARDLELILSTFESEN